MPIEFDEEKACYVLKGYNYIIKSSDPAKKESKYMEYGTEILNFLKIKDYIQITSCMNPGLIVEGKIIKLDRIYVTVEPSYIFIYNSEGKRELQPIKESAYLIEKNEIYGINLLDYKTREKINPIGSCSICKENVKISKTDYIKYYKGKFVCQSCFKNNLALCKKCSRLILKENSKTFNGKSYCINCYLQLSKSCGLCQKNLSETSKFQGLDGTFYCSYCYDSLFSVCGCCGGLKWKEELIENEILKLSHCVKCDPFRNMQLIHPYSYRPPEILFKASKKEKTKKATKDLFFGIELEIEPNEKIRNLQKRTYLFSRFLKENNLDNMFYFKSDSSIKGFEIVSQPFTSKYAHENLKWNKIFTFLKENGFTSYKSGSCGLHIHISANYFNRSQTANIRLFINKCKSYLEPFSMRGSGTNNFCKYEEIRYLNKQVLMQKLQEGRHWAVNINTGKNTIELRIFRGTLYYPRFIATIQFADAMANFIKETSFPFIFNSNPSSIWNYFLDWVKDKNKYNHFLNYYKQKCFCSTIKEEI